MVVRGPENARQPDNVVWLSEVVRGGCPPTLEQFPPPYNLHFQARKKSRRRRPRKIDREAPQAQKIEKRRRRPPRIWKIGAAGPRKLKKRGRMHYKK